MYRNVPVVFPWYSFGQYLSHILDAQIQTSLSKSLARFFCFLHIKERTVLYMLQFNKIFGFIHFTSQWF